ncbi:MAG: beta-propeller fold lactonase family protein [Candidatus Hydrogenedentes bacterium]|nr:beta-propeller fold lactonase family protein [Candidatus Hydrogenedentota bacterium]
MAGIDEAIRKGPRDFLEKAVVGPQGDGTYVVATTQKVDPAGETVLFPGRPIDLAVRPDRSLLAVKNFRDLVFIDLASCKIVQTLPFPQKMGHSVCGIVWSSDGNRCWTTEANRFLFSASHQSDGSYAWADQILLPALDPKDDEPAPAGLALDEPAGRIYVTLSRKNSLAVVNLADKKVEVEIPVGMAPYGVLLKGSRAYVTNWGGRRPTANDSTGPSSGSRVLVDPKTGIAASGTVSVVDLTTRAVVQEVVVGLHPCGMVLSPDGEFLYVANANSDTVSVIRTESGKVVDTLSTKPLAELPFGSAPNALAVSQDGATLYIANGGNNCLAVIDVARRSVKGLIPTGWYPGAVLLTRDGGQLIVANTKGVGSLYEKANLAEKQKEIGGTVRGHNSHDHMGSVSFIAVPDEEELEDYTFRVAENMRLPLMHSILNSKKAATRTVPVPTRPGEVSVFKHVLYIIKENRTYDQIFGDMPQGNGDAALCQFGRFVTPNHHALAEEFVLLDNFYCNGVLSADGHQWTNEGYVTDYLEKSFGDFVRSYPYEGEDALAFASSGFIWDHVLRKGLTFRDYGEFVTAKIEPRTATWADIYKDYVEGTRNVTIRATSRLTQLEPYLCPTTIGFPGKMQDVYRAQEFIRELKDSEAKGEWPNFIIMLLPNDHTSGTREGMPTPRACVADNDLALGRVVEAVSHSKFWPETVILVVEDDPQAGLDHVDGHRTVALCISPYTKRHVVKSNHYSQTSMVRTMELILGLAPMNQLTMAANPMTECFQEIPDLTPYTALPNNVPLDEMNPKRVSLRGKQRYWAEKSMELPLDDIDQADEDTLNRILWHSVKGYDTPYPKLAQRKAAGAEAWPGTPLPDED